MAEKFSAAREKYPLTLILCVYKRIDRFKKTLEMLNRQSDKDFKLFVWNNSADSSLATRADEYSLGYPCVVHSTGRNEGSWAYVLAARMLCLKSEYIAFIGDDQVFGSEFVSMLKGDAAQKAVVGGFAWKFYPGKGYWDRKRAMPGQEAHFIGGAGAVYDASLFLDPAIALGCPLKFKAVEDLWLSYYASHVMGWRTYCGQTKTNLVSDAKDQWAGLIATKSQFLEYLRQQGWKV